MAETSTKPYLIRAIYEWCTDNGYTPYLAALADGNARVPREFVKNGEIVLNISFGATSGLKMENDVVHFAARFGGVSRDIWVPIENVVAIYARENGQGMAFEVSKFSAGDAPPVPGSNAFDGPAGGAIAPPTLSSVPSLVLEEALIAEGDDASDGDRPEPPKKGGKPFLTRVK
ncbi:MAG: ClpXP protease specificity-enhancing factor [Pseudomonadota bacterium]